jgi:hypothetical protein
MSRSSQPAGIGELEPPIHTTREQSTGDFARLVGDVGNSAVSRTHWNNISETFRIKVQDLEESGRSELYGLKTLRRDSHISSLNYWYYYVLLVFLLRQDEVVTDPRQQGQQAVDGLDSL